MMWYPCEDNQSATVSSPRSPSFLVDIFGEQVFQVDRSSDEEFRGF